MLENAFFCEKCRSDISGMEKIFFVEDFSDRGFCSENCIKGFYKPFMELLEREEQEFRSTIKLDEEDDYLDLLAGESLLDDAINIPDEIWIFTTEVDQKFYTHIKKISSQGRSLYFVLICSYIEDGPSFVYYRTITESKTLVDYYRRSVQIETQSFLNTDTNHITSEVIELLDSKKSALLAELLTLRSEDDIGFELFMDYEKYLKGTMDVPDEIYRFIDEAGDDVFTFIKSFLTEEDEQTIFYVVLAHAHEGQNGETLMLPILSFPSNDDALYPQYTKGERMNEKLRN